MCSRICEMKLLCESMVPLDLNPGTGATSRVCSSLVRCFNGPRCKWHSVGVCGYRHETSEHDIVTKKHDQSDAPGRLSRIMDELEQILQLLQGAARDFCGQERMGDKTEEPGVPGELIAKPVNSDVCRGCEALATSEWFSLANPEEEPKTDEASKCEDAKSKPHHTLKRPHRAVSKAWNSGTWDWLEPTGTELRKARLCRQGRELLRQWRDLCGPGPGPGRRARPLLYERESSEVSSSDHSGEKRRLTHDTEGDSEEDDTSDVLNDLGSDDQQSVEPTRGAGIGSDPTRYPPMPRVKGGRMGPFTQQYWKQYSKHFLR